MPSSSRLGLARLGAVLTDGHLGWRLRARLRRSAGAALARALDGRRCTYGPWAGDALALHAPLPPPEVLAGCRHALAGMAAMYLEHRFDLLGSGWVRVRHGMRCRGIGGVAYPPAPPVDADPEGAWLRGRATPANLAAARAAWRLVDPGYVPIDWHLDVRSGHRYPETAWHGDVPVGRPRGADVKVPWELARMQHLPQLALAHALGEREGAPSPRVLAREFRNQVLDFVAANPPGFGVNWACPMDVGIRAANWALAYALFVSGGAEFDAPFRRELARSLAAHGRHVAGHLEWAPVYRGNHYLANVAALLVLGATLPSTPDADAWLAFGVRELEAETAWQFHPDGGNVEASTAYHRLSAEMVAWGTAVALGLDADRRAGVDRYDGRAFGGRRIPPSGGGAVPGLDGPSPFAPAHFGRLARMAAFTAGVATPAGTVPQVGDNDSGRFFKLAPPVRRLRVDQAVRRYASLEGFDELPDPADYWDEDPLRQDALPALVDAVVDGAGQVLSPEGALERAVARGVARGRAVPRREVQPDDDAAARVRVAGESAWAAADAEVRRGGLAVRTTVFPVPGGGAREGLELRAWPDFGLWLFRSRRVYLLVRCGPVGTRGLGAHDHADQLALELWVDGTPRVADPGTGVYTSLPEVRNRYRSVRAHFAPRLDTGEPAGLDSGLFRLWPASAGHCAYFGPAGFMGSHTGYGRAVARRVMLLEDGVRVDDWVPGRPEGPAPADPHPDPAVAPSPGYGRVLRLEGRGEAGGERSTEQGTA